MKIIFEDFTGLTGLHNNPMIYDLPIMGGLRGMAREFGLEVCPRPNSWWENIPKDHESQICFWNVSDRLEDWARFIAYKKACPYAKIIGFGSDTLYIPKWEFLSLPWSVLDLYLDCSQAGVDRVEALIVPSEFFFWSVSKSELALIESLYRPAQKDIDAIGLYRKTSYRESLFWGLQRLGHNTVLAPGEWDFAKVVALFARSQVSVGVADCVISPGGARSGKGFRDFIGPECGCVLAYEAFPDAVTAWGEKGIVPIFPYGDSYELGKIIDRVKSDSEYRDGLLSRQRAWASDNTTDAQFKRIFLKHNLLSGVPA